jgi:hypothetical protein
LVATAAEDCLSIRRRNPHTSFAVASDCRKLQRAATPRIALFAGKAVEVQDDDRPLRQHRLDTLA